MKKLYEEMPGEEKGFYDVLLELFEEVLGIRRDNKEDIILMDDLLFEEDAGHPNMTHLRKSIEKKLSLTKLAELIRKTREILASKEEHKITLPRLGKLISVFSDEVAEVLKDKEVLFYRPDIEQVVEVGSILHKEIKEDDEEQETKSFTGFIVIKPGRFITLAERYCTPGLESFSKDGEVSFRSRSMTKDLANTVLESPMLQDTLPSINRIFTTPIPIMHERKLTFPCVGYNYNLKSWLPYNSPQIINEKMSLKESIAVLDFILREFCFKSDEDYTIAIAGLITPFLRGLYHSFTCRTPVFVYGANRPRIGKDYLAGIRGIIYEGVAIENPAISYTKNKGNAEDELRKTVVSIFMSGRKIVHFGNNKGHLDNAVLEGLCTTKVFTARILGQNNSIKSDNDLEISLSGNLGISYTADFIGRARFCSQSYDKEDINKRTFDNPNLQKWVQDNRSLILSAMYGLVMNWKKNKYKPGSKAFTSYPEWARVCGGVMEAAGYDSPCNPNPDVLIGGDTETRDMKTLFEEANKNYQGVPRDYKDIKDLVAEFELFDYLDLNERSGQSSFGRILVKFTDRILSDIRMTVSSTKARTSNRKFTFTKNEAEIE